MEQRDARREVGDARSARVTGAPLRLERRTDGRLWALRDGAAARAVGVVRCFPWTAPYRHLSLRDEDGEEVAYVTDPAELDGRSRAALAESVRTARFVLDVTRVHRVDEDFEIRCWEVETRQGPRRFQTPLDSWPREAPGGALLVEDVAGDLYRIPPLAHLDGASRKQIWAFVD